MLWNTSMLITFGVGDSTGDSVFLYTVNPGGAAVIERMAMTLMEKWGAEILKSPCCVSGNKL